MITITNIQKQPVNTFEVNISIIGVLNFTINMRAVEALTIQIYLSVSFSLKKKSIYINKTEQKAGYSEKNNKNI